MKKNRKKLTLNRETIRHLDASRLQGVAGGQSELEWQCGPDTGPETICNDTTCEFPGGGTIPTVPTVPTLENCTQQHC